jgi:arylsulfatase A-like enzyme
VFTTDHGELQGDFGLLFKGPYHVDALLRLPLIYRPAPNAQVAPGRVASPVSLVDLAPTFCAAAGVDVPEWMEGAPLPLTDDAVRRDASVITEWDSIHPRGHRVHARTIVDGDLLATAYSPGTMHDGSEGELYRLTDDPLQRENRWAEPRARSRRDELVAEVRRIAPPLPPRGVRRGAAAPV